MIIANDLLPLISKSAAPVLIHVLPEEDFAEAHIPGAQCFCVYESAFIGKITAAFPDQSTALIVYGASDDTIEAETAIAKLTAAGFPNVERLADGLKGWVANGGSVEGTGPSASKPLTGTFAPDLAKSVIYWTGRNLFNHHHGSVLLAGAAINVLEDKLVSARFTIDMASLACSDLTDPALNAGLIGHLKSDDFFAVNEHPTAEFKTTAVTPIAACTSGTNTHHVEGQFTLRGKTHPLAFPALVAKGPDGSLTLQAEFDFDRTLWGAVYGSGKFFARLANHVVNDLVHLHIKLRFEPCN